MERHIGDAAHAHKDDQRCADWLPAAICQNINAADAQPGDLGLALVHLGRTSEALAQGRHGIAQSASPTNVDKSLAWVLMARIQAQAGRTGAAIATLEHLSASPDAGLDISVPLLRLDPVWDPIRKDPRFQALLKKYSQSAPASAASTASATAATRG